MKVKATKLGHFGVLREEGAVFEIQSEKQFSKNWMEKIDADKPAAAPKAPKGAKAGKGGKAAESEEAQESDESKDESPI